jgi:hypothetical protein
MPNHFAILKYYPQMSAEDTSSWHTTQHDPNTSWEEELIHHAQHYEEAELLFRVLDFNDIEIQPDMLYELKGQDAQSKAQYIEAIIKE